MSGSSLNASRRAAELESLAAGEVVDILVAGGGITGAGVALDAASRGLRVALCERRDLAYGTSRYSSKLVHGGLRYLVSGEPGIAWECARERTLLLSRIAPHLVRPLPFVWPLNHHLSRRMRVGVRAVLHAGDVLRRAARTPRRSLPPPRRISPAEIAALVPGVAMKGLDGGLLYFDGQVEDDARLVVAVARTAALHGARILTYCEVEKVDGDSVSVVDALSGSRLELRARCVVNATGVWAGELEREVRLRPSKGSHLVVAARALGYPGATLQVPVPGSRSSAMLAIPTGDDRVLVGLTDLPYDGPLHDAPQVEPGEESFLLETVNRALAVPLQSSDVIARYAGLRPLVAGEASAVTDLSRRHAIHVDSDSGMITVVGGKLTTYRRMAQEVVDRVAKPHARSCRTATLPLVGAGTTASRGAPRLIRRYGAEADRVAALERRAGSSLAAEIAFAFQHEGALTIEDAVDRRLRLDLDPAAREAVIQEVGNSTVIPS